MSRFQVVITDLDQLSHDYEMRVLTAAGADLRLEQCRTEADVAARCGDADGLLVQYAPIGKTALAGLPRCRVVVRYGVGYEQFDLDALTEHGVWACNVPDYGTEEVATQTIALMLDLNRQVTKLANSTARGSWDAMLARPLRRLRGQTLGIIGLGRNGGAVARKVRGLELRVLAYDPHKPQERFAAVSAEAVGFEELLGMSDYVSLHVPLNAETRNMIGARALVRMRPTAYLINTSRGGVVDEHALAEALTGGKLAGAGLDVLRDEPPPSGHPLVGFPNCLVLPHSAWYSEESFVDLKTKAAEEVARVLRGEEPSHPLNPAVRSTVKRRTFPV